MKRKTYLSLFVYFMAVGAAVGGNNNNELLSAWGNVEMEHCKNANMGSASIGSAKETCTGNSNSACKLGDDYGTMMMVAREANENGAKFCPTTVYADHKKKGKSWTLYSSPHATSPKDKMHSCVWLCKPGYYGEACAFTAPNGCDATPIKRSDYDKYKLSRASDVESSVLMFHWDQYDKCGGHKSTAYEHDMILAISEWLPGEHGVLAQPFVVRAMRDGWKTTTGWATPWRVGTPQILCKNGYTANAAGNECVPADANLCAATQLCTGWDATGFSADTMVMDYNDANGCYTYRCAIPGYAFESVSTKRCINCVTDARSGLSPADATCVKCPLGQIFDENAASTGYCRNTVAVTKTDMMYGKGQTKNTQTKIENQCWTKVVTDEYRTCVGLTSGSSGGTTTTTTTTTTTPTPPAATPPTKTPPATPTTPTTNTGGGGGGGSGSRLDTTLDIIDSLSGGRTKVDTVESVKTMLY